MLWNGRGKVVMERNRRLEQDAKLALSNIINYEVKNKDVDGLISVTDVKITPDQKYMTVYVSIFGKSKVKALEGLNKSNGFIKNMLSNKVKFRVMPEITFKIDDSMEYGAKMDKLIDEVVKKDNNEKND